MRYRRPSVRTMLLNPRRSPGIAAASLAFSRPIASWWTARAWPATCRRSRRPIRKSTSRCAPSPKRSAPNGRQRNQRRHLRRAGKSVAGACASVTGAQRSTACRSRFNQRAVFRCGPARDGLALRPRPARRRPRDVRSPHRDDSSDGRPASASFRALRLPRPPTTPNASAISVRSRREVGNRSRAWSVEPGRSVVAKMCESARADADAPTVVLVLFAG